MGPYECRLGDMWKGGLCCRGWLAGYRRFRLGRRDWVLLVIDKSVLQGIKVCGISIRELLVSCGLERRRLGLGMLGTVQYVEIMALVSEGLLGASGAADPVEVEEGWLVKAVQYVLMVVKGVEFDG